MAFLPPPALPTQHQSRHPARHKTYSIANTTHPVSAPRARRPRARPSAADAELHARASPARKLRAARSTLRKRTGVDPGLADTVRYASVSDHSVSPHLPDWLVVYAARNRLTVKWLWLVTAVARKVYHTYVTSFPEMRAALSLGDLVQEGVVGLITAVERWDARRGYPFESFAFYSVKQAILRAIENQSRPIRLPVHVLNKLARMRKVRDTLERETGVADVESIARDAGVSVKAAELYLARSNSTLSIDAPAAHPSRSAAGGVSASSTPDSPLRDFLVDHSVDVAREVERAITREAVSDLLEQTDLLELERSVLFLKFGLDDGVERMRAEVSRILDVRVHSVRRAEISALKKLRHTIGDNVSVWTELIW